MSKILYTDKDHILDQGKPLWPPREPPTDKEQQVIDAIAKLAPAHKLVIELRWYGNYTYNQIGAELGITKQAAHRAYTRAMNKLKEHLK